SLGLAVLGAEAFSVLREARARRAAWRRYEDRLSHAAPAEPGATVRLEPGERAPLLARVLEGTGTAFGRDGLPVPLAPGAVVPAGAGLGGGPFHLRLEGGEMFLAQPRSTPVLPTLYSRYLRLLGPLSLGYGVLTALLTRSLARTFYALLLVNPGSAIMGAEAA